MGPFLSMLSLIMKPEVVLAAIDSVVEINIKTEEGCKPVWPSGKALGW